METESVARVELAIASQVIQEQHAKIIARTCAKAKASAQMADACASQVSSELIAQSKLAAVGTEIALCQVRVFVILAGWVRSARLVWAAQIQAAVVMELAQMEVVHVPPASVVSHASCNLQSVQNARKMVSATEMPACVCAEVFHVH